MILKRYWFSFMSGIFIFLVLLSVSCTTKNRPPVILISIDTLRADHLQFAGYFRNTAPNLEKLARNSMIFERAYAQSPNTAISHATMLTGLQPILHGCSPGFMLMDDIKTLAEYFREKEYVTGGFATHGAWLSPSMGFDQGFDEFYSKFVSAPDINRRIFPFLEKNSRKDFFLFLHYYDVHSDYSGLPYETGTDFDKKYCGDYQGDFSGCREGVCASKLLDRFNTDKSPVSEEDIQYLKDLYDGGISFTDYHLGRLFAKLRELDIYDRAMIVITADHGEEFREHGKFLHSQFYTETMHVPLIIKLPGKNPQIRVKQLVGVVDITPTLLDFADIEWENLSGSSLLSLNDSRDSADTRVVYSSQLETCLAKSKELALRTADYTFVTWENWSREKLFSFRDDPGELNDISLRFPRVVRKFKKLARRSYFERVSLRKKMNMAYRETMQSRKDRAMLKSLGYL